MSGAGRLLPGAQHFQVTEELAYPLSGQGEHLAVEVEKRGLTTDAVAEALARACGVPRRAVGYAGRKDRHAIARQWFSVLGGEERQLARLPFTTQELAIRAVTRHRHKIRLGHAARNRFRLGLADADPAALAAALARLQQEGIVNRFGPQRFGIGGVNARIARAWGEGRHADAVALVVDPDGGWRWGEPLPDGWRPAPEGRVLAALRAGASPAAALRAAPALRQLIASAAQALVCNAVIEARARAGLLRRARAGDVLCTARGAPFVLRPEDVADAERRLALLELSTTAPLPGSWRLQPAPDIVAEERAWSADTGIPWAWFADGGPFASPGERRPCLITFAGPPRLVPEPPRLWLEFALPPGAYATEVLVQCGVALPADRSGAASADG